MLKEYKYINFLGRTLDDAISVLIKSRDIGQLTCLKFNGVTLYADTSEINKAYKDILGMTKLEFDTKYNNQL